MLFIPEMFDADITWPCFSVMICILKFRHVTLIWTFIITQYNLVHFVIMVLGFISMCSQSLVGWWKPTIIFISMVSNQLRVRQWLKKDTLFYIHISVSFAQGILVLQPRWHCTTQNTIFFSNLSVSFHFFVDFVKNLQLCVNRYWWTFASHCDIWLLIACFVFRGESPGRCLISTASMFEWLRNSSPTTHRGAVRKDGAEKPWGWSLPECFTSSGGLYVSLYFNTDRKLSL